MSSKHFQYGICHYCLPLERGLVLHLNKFETPSPKNAYCQVCLKFAQWFLNVTNVFRYYLPLN